MTTNLVFAIPNLMTFISLDFCLRIEYIVCGSCKNIFSDCRFIETNKQYSSGTVEGQSHSKFGHQKSIRFQGA